MTAVPAPADVPATPSRWRASPARLARLLLGLVLFGAGDALIVSTALGNAPWTVFAQGVSLWTPLSIGSATQVIGAVVLLLWLLVRERPGLGTVANVVVIGLVIDGVLLVLPPAQHVAVRILLLVAGTALVGLGSGFYLGADLGPGPRDGLMTGIARRSGRPVWLVRAGIELTVLTAGFALGGTVGLGTVAFALLIGPSVQLGMRVTRTRRRSATGMPRA